MTTFNVLCLFCAVFESQFQEPCACSEFICLSSLCFIPTGVVEVYRVTKRVELGIKATAVCSEKLQQLLKDIDKVWNNLISFMSLAALTVRPKISYMFTRRNLIIICKMTSWGVLTFLFFFSSCKMEIHLFVKSSLKLCVRKLIYVQILCYVSNLMVGYPVCLWTSLIREK